jgi:Xaa-Pro aminopeptidase
MNYQANTYPFRQDSSFSLFLWSGFAWPGAVLDVDEGKEIIFGRRYYLEDIIWVGPQPPLKERAKASGLKQVRPSASLIDYLAEASSRGRQIIISTLPRRDHSQIMLVAENSSRASQDWSFQ